MQAVQYHLRRGDLLNLRNCEMLHCNQAFVMPTSCAMQGCCQTNSLQEEAKARLTHLCRDIMSQVRCRG